MSAQTPRPTRIASVAALILLMLSSLPAVAVREFNIEGFAFEIRSLSEWDGSLAEFRKLVWMMHDGSQFTPPDRRGRTPASFVNEWMFTRDAESRFRTLREAAQKQSDAGESAALERSLQEATTLLLTEAYRADLSQRYWGLLSAFSHHESVIDSLRTQLGIERDDALAARVHPLMEQLGDAVWAAMPAEGDKRLAEAVSLNRKVLEIFGHYNEARAKLAERLDAKNQSEGRAPYGRARNTPCGEPVTETSRKNIPGLRDSTALESLYPPLSKDNGVQGLVAIRLTISSTGCMLRGEIRNSSGVPELDEAAIQWAEGSSFLPAERDGQAVEGVMSMRVRFEIKD
jgi:TonB family protein